MILAIVIPYIVASIIAHANRHVIRCAWCGQECTRRFIWTVAGPKCRDNVHYEFP